MGRHSMMAFLEGATGVKTAATAGVKNGV